MPIDISRIRALCFDVDGTLSDTDDQWVARFTKILTPVHFFFPRGKPLGFARWLVMGLETPGNFLYWMLDSLHLDSALARAFDDGAKRRVDRRRKYWVIPGVPEMLAALHTRYPMAVVSARDEASTLAFLDQFSLRPFFQVVVTSQTCLHTKPYPHPVLYAAEKMGVPPAACVMIGDTTVDIRAGRSAGAQTVGVLCGFGMPRELTRAGADLLLDSTADVAGLLSA